MTDFEQYKEHIEYTFNAFCKIVIRHAAIDESRRLKSTWEHEISFEYLTEEKFYPFSTEDVYFAEPEERPEYPVFICGQMIMLDNPQLAAALPRLPEQWRDMLYLRFYEYYTYQKISEIYGKTALQSAAISRNPCGCCMRKWRWCPVSRKLLPYETIVKAHEGNPEAVEAVLSHYAGYIKYVSMMNGRVNSDVEEHVKLKLIESLMKFRFDR